MLAFNSTLRMVDLSFGGLTDKAVAMLIQAYKGIEIDGKTGKNITCPIVDIFNNPLVGDSLKEKLDDALIKIPEDEEEEEDGVNPLDFDSADDDSDDDQ